MSVSEYCVAISEFFFLISNLIKPRRQHLKKQIDHEQTDCTKSSQVELHNFDIDSLSSCEIAPETEDALRQHKIEKEVFGTINNSISTSSPCNVSNKDDICLSSLGSIVKVSVSSGVIGSSSVSVSSGVSSMSLRSQMSEMLDVDGKLCE